MTALKRFLLAEDGPTATEYAVALSFVLIAAVASIAVFGTTLAALFDSINGNMPGQ